MKKLFFLWILLPLFSCEGPMGPMGPEGPAGTYMYSATFTIKESDWRVAYPNDDYMEAYQYVYVEVPAINKDVFDYGVVLVFKHVGDGVKELLPLIRYYGETVEEEVDGEKINKDYFWQQSYGYDYYYDSSTRTGGVGIYFTDSEFYTDSPGEQTFDVKLIWD